MTTRVIATGRSGQPETFVYNRQNPPLGAGDTGIVYEGWAESAPTERVAIKVARSADGSDIKRELEILKRLYQPGVPGGEAVIWAAEGKETGDILAAPCMVMELISGENQLSKRLAAFGNRKLYEDDQEVDIFMKEAIATSSAVRYAQLLVRMSNEGIISRGDRKAADFRLIDGVSKDTRLVVLDWNRAEIIDVDALKKGNWGESVIRRREDELNQGKIADIQIFARWWAEFVLEESIKGTLMEKETGEDPAWLALTRGFRYILLSAEAAGSPRGFRSAEELNIALGRHLTYLYKNRGQLLQELGSLANRSPIIREDMLSLVDLAKRRRVSSDELEEFRRLAERGGSQALAIAQNTLTEMKNGDLRMREWDRARRTIDGARQQIGQITPQSAEAHLLLLRWDVAAQAAEHVGRAVDYNVHNKWLERMWKVSDTMARLSDDSRAVEDTRNLLDELSWDNTLSQHTQGLRPLTLELELRDINKLKTEDEVAKRFNELHGLHPGYADAVRAAVPSLDTILADITKSKAAKEDQNKLRNELTVAYNALFAQFSNDVEKGNLPPANRQSARELREGQNGSSYRSSWESFYNARFKLKSAGYQVDAGMDAGSMWLDTLLSHMFRLRADDAAQLLVDQPPQRFPSGFDLRMIRNKWFETWLNQLQQPREASRSRWPIEIDRALHVVKIISDNSHLLELPGANEVLSQLEQAKHDLGNLQSRLDVEQYSRTNNWAAFLKHITTSGPNSDEIDVALGEAIDKQLEVWQPDPVAEAAFNADYVDDVLEGYRVGTLLSLRTATLLPERVRQYSSQLNDFTDQLVQNRSRAEEVRNYLGDAVGYPAHKAMLAESLYQMGDALHRYTRTREDIESAKAHAGSIINEITTEQTTLERWRNTLDQFNEEIYASIRKASRAFGPTSPLAEIWLAHSLTQAVMLDFDKALDSISHARAIHSESEVLNQSATSLASSIQELIEQTKADDGQGEKWKALKRVKDMMATGNKAEAEVAMGRVKVLIPEWSNNMVLSALDRHVQRLSTFADGSPSATETDQTAPEQPQPIKETPDSGDRSKPQTLEPPNINIDDEHRRVEGLWARVKNPNKVPNLESVKEAVTQTDNLLQNHKTSLSTSQLRSLQQRINKAIDDSSWEDSNLEADDNNFGNLYILKLKVQWLLDQGK